MMIRNGFLLCAAGVVVLAAVRAGAGTNCVANAATNRDVRAEGVTEQVGDILLTCTGGTPTPSGQPVPLMNIHITLQVPITSRTMGTVLPAGSQTPVLTSEATLLIDEPFPANPVPANATPISFSPLKQISCLADGGVVGGVGQCEILGTGDGVSTYLNQYNTFQGLSTVDPISGLASIDFIGVPFDAPSASNPRIISITNLRGDMSQLPKGNPYITVFGTISFPINPGITPVRSDIQLAPVFPGLQTSPCAFSSGTLTCTAAEGYASSFKTAVISSSDLSGSLLNSVRSMAGGTLETQNVPNVVTYHTESGLIVPASSFTGSGIGQATHGTWLVVSLSNIPSGVQITAPGVVNGDSNSPNLQLYRIDVAPGWTFNPAFYASPPADKMIVDTTGSNPPTTALAVYEVVADNPNLQETANIPLSVAAQQGVDASVVQGTVTFAPVPNAPLEFAGSISAWMSPQGSLDIPRFLYSTVPPPVAYTLTLNASPSAGGTASANIPPINGQYAAGTFVCLTANPNSGYVFWTWSGATLDGSNCLNITANTTVTAKFVPVAGPSGVNNRSFVSAQGNDANNCGVSSACRTLMDALAMTNGGGEIILLNSGDYGPATIAQPVTISATGIDASITATSGNALTINTPGNVTIRGLNLHGLGTGNDGVLVQHVGILRLYDVTAESFANAGVEMDASGDLALYDSRFTDNGSGLAVFSPLAKVYVHKTSFDHNYSAGVYLFDGAPGAAVVTDASAHFNGTGFDAYVSGVMVLAADRSVFNGYGIGIGVYSVQYASCSVALNTQSSYKFPNAGGDVPDGTSPGTSLVSGPALGWEATPTTLQ
jgi:hypothetical protein